MNNFNLLEGWVSSLGRMIGLDLEFDRNRVCTMLYEDNICLSLAPCEGNEDAFIITGPVLALTMDPVVDNSIFRAVLKMNFLGSETGYGGVLGLGLYDGMIIFAHTLYFGECDEILLQNIVQNAAYNIKSLREAISSHLEIEIKAKSKVQETLINPLLMYGNFV
jgi:hypothetical protein